MAWTNPSVHSAPDTVLSDAGRKNSRAAIAALYARARRSEHLTQQQAFLLDSVCELLATDDLYCATDALADSLKIRFNCTRVAVALNREKKQDIVSIAQQATIASSTAEKALLLSAANEAIDQESIVQWPSSDRVQGIRAAHRALASRGGEWRICTVPLFARQKPVGAIVLERQGEGEFPIEALERLSITLSPLISQHVRASANTLQVLRRQTASVLVRYLGPNRPANRLFGLLAAVSLTASILIPVNQEIVSTAELLPSTSRHVTSPENGFIAQTLVEAGDHVEQGQVLAKLDRREVEIELAGIDSEIALAEAEFRAAMADYDRQAIAIARARLAQQRARRSRVNARLERLHLIAPMDGILMRADSARNTGTAVTRGETLFEIAPDETFDVHLYVAESDIHQLTEGQTGQLSLHSDPTTKLPITISILHPVAETGNGATRFRVKAALSDSVNLLHAGQGGTVRITTGKTNTVAKLTRRLRQQLSRLWWRYIG